MIAVEHLVKQYGRFTAVDDVSLDVQPGEIHGFLGPNGAGKTTTLRMIAGLLKPTSGRVVVDGHNVALEPEQAKSSLGFIPDRPFIYEKLTAGEFLRFHGGLYGLEGDGVMDRVHEMLDLFELRRVEHDLVESFSHGMKQRLVMCAETDDAIAPEQLAPWISDELPMLPTAAPLRDVMKQLQAAVIQSRLREHGYSRKDTARSLGITREALWQKLKALGLIPSGESS